jgi:hypothetical protein
MDKNISPKPPRYSAYLLRFWNELSAEPAMGLRVTVIDLRTGEQWGFADPERLFDFLKQKVCPDNNRANDAQF